MAITFSKSISILKILNSFNNNIVEFSSNNASPAKKCVINIGGQNITITPISGVFWYDFKDIVVTLINQNKFNDSILPTANNVVDSTLTGTWLVTFTITMEDDSTDVTQNTYYFVKSVEQIANVSNRLLSSQLILNKTTLTMFKGFPFEVARFSNGNSTLTNSNSAVTGSVVLTSVDNDIERIWFSRGNSIMQAATPTQDFIVEGFNDINFSGVSSFNIAIMMKDIKCGTYLKWFNEDGSWSYWLFNEIHKTNLQTKTSGTFKNDFESIDNTFSTKLTISRSATKTRNLIADSLTPDQRLQLDSILSSPRIEMYNGVYNDAVTNASWQTVLIKDGTFNVEDTKIIGNTNLRITIEINKYTQR